MSTEKLRILPVILISGGGLGNQLSIIALAHEISKKHRLVIVLFSPWNYRGNDSAVLSSYCTHNIHYWNFKISRKPCYPELLNRMVNYLQGAFIEFLSFFAKDVARSFIMKNSYDLGFILKGCLQRSELVTLNPDFTKEVISRITDEKVTKLFDSNALCHIRRGDYTSTDYYGLLTFDYYKKALETVQKSKPAVISDDQHAGLHLAKVLDGVFIDTADLPPFTLLKIMMLHEVVVSANSSLS